MVGRQSQFKIKRNAIRKKNYGFILVIYLFSKYFILFIH